MMGGSGRAQRPERVESTAPHRAGQVSENAELRRAERPADVWFVTFRTKFARSDIVKLYSIFSAVLHRDDPRVLGQALQRLPLLDTLVKVRAQPHLAWVQPAVHAP